MNSNTNNAGGAQNKDYLDKGLDAVEKKFGGKWGQNTEKNRGINEKIVRLTCTIHLLYMASLHGTNTARRPMAHAKCLRSSRAKRSRAKSQTRAVEETPRCETEERGAGQGCEGDGEKPGFLARLSECWVKVRPTFERLNGWM